LKEIETRRGDIEAIVAAYQEGLEKGADILSGAEGYATAPFAADNRAAQLKGALEVEGVRDEDMPFTIRHPYGTNFIPFGSFAQQHSVNQLLKSLAANNPKLLQAMLVDKKRAKELGGEYADWTGDEKYDVSGIDREKRQVMQTSGAGSALGSALLGAGPARSGHLRGIQKALAAKGEISEADIDDSFTGRHPIGTTLAGRVAGLPVGLLSGVNPADIVTGTMIHDNIKQTAKSLRGKSPTARRLMAKDVQEEADAKKDAKKEKKMRKDSNATVAARALDRMFEKQSGTGLGAMIGQRFGPGAEQNFRAVGDYTKANMTPGLIGAGAGALGGFVLGGGTLWDRIKRALMYGAIGGGVGLAAPWAMGKVRGMFTSKPKPTAGSITSGDPAQAAQAVQDAASDEAAAAVLPETPGAPGDSLIQEVNQQSQVVPRG
jgi:hypothetical protein